MGHKGYNNLENMTKISKNLDVILNLDKETYKLEAKNYHPTKTKKSQILLGGSLRKDSNHILHLQHKDFGQSKKWPTFSITREGHIYQHFDPQFYSDYFGVKEIDKKAITIVLENMGMLSYDANKECFVNWIDEECDDKFIYEKLWKNSRYWEIFYTEQYLSLAWLINQLIDEFNIKRDTLGYNVFDENTLEFEGIVTRSNYDSNFCDVNPSFDFKKIIELIKIE
jgi:hypothetical protein